MAEITTRFRERALLVTKYVVDKEMKKTRYHVMMRVDIREFISFLACRTLVDMIARSREQEIDLEHLGKRKAFQVQTIGSPMKRPNISDQRLRGQQGRGNYDTSGK